MFLGRGLVVAPEGGHVGVDHLYMGATLPLNSHVFRLTHADEFTLRYMEEHADEVGRYLLKSSESIFTAVNVEG